MGVFGVVVPALRARVDTVDEGGASNCQGTADLVSEVQPIGATGGGHITTIGVSGRQHRGSVLLPAFVHDTVDLPRRTECGVGAPWRTSRHLYVSVGVGLVVVHQNEQVVFVVRGEVPSADRPKSDSASFTVVEPKADRR